MKKQSALSDTDLCVMCGMCIPHCPTYQLHQTEAESPRGRIALIQSINNGNVDIDDVALHHIDHCLGCLNCQSTCPSQVPYGKIIDEFRDKHQEKAAPSKYASQALKLSASINGFNLLFSLADTPILGKALQFFEQRTSGTHYLNQKQPPAPHFSASDITPSQGQITLFAGCLGNITDSQTLKDSITLLNRLGFDTLINDTQQCCGALHKHNGQQDAAKQLIRQVEATARTQDSTTTLFFSPVCGASLNTAQLDIFEDARTFIYQQLKPSNLHFKAMTDPIALHESCGNRNMLGLKNINTELLGLIPELQTLTSKQPALCCGAGGLHAVKHPNTAKQLACTKLDSFDLNRAKYLVSDNIGCSMHMKSTLSAYNSDIEIIHPLSLLAKQLDD